MLKKKSLRSYYVLIVKSTDKSMIFYVTQIQTGIIYGRSPGKDRIAFPVLFTIINGSENSRRFRADNVI